MMHPEPPERLRIECNIRELHSCSAALIVGQCLSNRPRAWRRTNYTPIYLEGVDMTPRPKAKLETLKSRTIEKHNLDFSPSMANHKYRQPISLSVPTALPWGRDLYVLSCLGAFEMRVHDSPTA